MRIAEILIEPQPTKLWTMLKQIGVNEAVGVLPRNFSDWRQSKSTKPWDYVSLAIYKQMITEEGLDLVAIEDNPPMDALRRGGSGAQEELENVLSLIKNMGKLGIKTWCYNWMAEIGWLRTSTRLRGRGGAIVSGYNHDLLPADAFNQKALSSETLWINLEKFLKKVVPVAEQVGVQLAMHPDDPPMISSIGPTSRIMNSIESFEKLIELVPSPANGITLCQGNFTLMTPDLPKVIHQFGDAKKIFFVHFRDVKGTAQNFEETFIDNGNTDMVQCLRAYRDVNFSGIMRTDHTPTLEGDDAQVAGYSTLGRLHAIGYLQGAKQAILSEKL